jgi:hypothetical protein
VEERYDINFNNYYMYARNTTREMTDQWLAEWRWHQSPSLSRDPGDPVQENITHTHTHTHTAVQQWRSLIKYMYTMSCNIIKIIIMGMYKYYYSLGRGMCFGGYILALTFHDLVHLQSSSVYCRSSRDLHPTTSVPSQLTAKLVTKSSS